MIRRIDETVLTLPDGTDFRSTYPILEYCTRGDLLLVTSDPGDGRRNVRAVPLDAAGFERTHGRALLVWADVELGTTFEVDPADHRVFFAGGVRCEVPGWFQIIEEVSPGFAVLVDFNDVAARNLFLVGRDGGVCWQVATNAFFPAGALQQYESMYVDESGRLIAVSDRIGKFVIDPESGVPVPL